jgi:predicted ArsR family transcriptional regulator
MVINGKRFFTVQEMADELQIKSTAVKQRLYQARQKPIVKDALYAPSALEAIRNVPGKGRPRKPENPDK